MNRQTPPQPLFGFTGTNGKTAAVLLTGFILSRCGLSPAVLDTWKGNISFARFQRQAATDKNDCLLVEVPVDALRLRHISGESFAGAALTNLSLDHLKSCRTQKQYTAIKAAFFARLPAGAKVFVNADDPQSLSLAEEGHVEYLTYAVRYPNAMIVAGNLQRKNMGYTFDLTVKADFSGFGGVTVAPGSAPVRLRLTGLHNVANALLAAAVSLLFVPDVEAVARALSAFPGMRRNMEIIRFNGFTVVDDAATNPAALAAALTAADTLPAARILLLHGMYGGGGQVLNRCNALELAAWKKKHSGSRLFVTRSMYRCRKKHQVHLHEEKAFLTALQDTGTEFAYFPDLPDAVESLLSHAAPGDLLLLLGGPVLNRAQELLLHAAGGSLFHPAAGRQAESDAQALLPNPT
ncbi:MAG TPA: hypothetical protein GX699_04970 [Firmicutes bacterium]|nr:hypothetical protein [Bacillota bacterium]